MTTDRSANWQEAIFDIQARLVGVEKTLIGTPGTDDKGLCGDVKGAMNLAVENKDKIIEHAGRLIALETRNQYRNSSGYPVPSKKKQAGFASTIGGFLAAAFYALGCKLGWW